MYLFLFCISVLISGEVPSLNAYDKNGIKIVFHFAKGRPREDVTVVVVSIMSTAASPIKTLTFQAAVPKVRL